MSKLPTESIIKRYDDLNEEMAQTPDTQELIRLSKKQKSLGEQASLATRINQCEAIIAQNVELLEQLTDADEEMRLLTIEETEAKKQELQQLESQLMIYLTPSDPKDDNDVILEMRAGAGGDESALFAGELLKSYQIMCQKMGFNLSIIDASVNTIGGYKEVIAEIRGSGAFSWFKYEGGVHRVQRVPATEKQGRVHTSTIGVIALPLIEENSDFKLDLKEVEIVASTSQGAGGQSVNTTYSAIKVKHLPTGIEAQCQDERNQAQNKIKALQVLTSRVFDFYEQKRLEKEASERKEQVKANDRSEKIRTYNFPQDRLTDHRYNHNWNQLDIIMTGGIYQVIEDIRKMEAERVLDNLH